MNRFFRRNPRDRDEERRTLLPPAIREIFLPFIEARDRRRRRRQERLGRKAQRAAEQLLHPKSRQERIEELRGKIYFPNIPALHEIFVPWVELYERIRGIRQEEQPPAEEELDAGASVQEQAPAAEESEPEAPEPPDAPQADLPEFIFLPWEEEDELAAELAKIEAEIASIVPPEAEIAEVALERPAPEVETVAFVEKPDLPEERTAEQPVGPPARRESRLLVLKIPGLQTRLVLRIPPFPRLKLRLPKTRLPRPKLSKPALPKIPLSKLPKPALPKPKLPIIKLPRLKLPTIKLPRPKLPKISLSRLRLPKIGWPKLRLPGFRLPSLRLPSIGQKRRKLPVPQAATPIEETLPVESTPETVVAEETPVAEPTIEAVPEIEPLSESETPAEIQPAPSDLFPDYPPSFELPERRLRLRRKRGEKSGPKRPRFRLPRLGLPKWPSLRRKGVRQPPAQLPPFPGPEAGRPPVRAAAPPPPPRPPRRRTTWQEWDEVPHFKFFRPDPWRAQDRVETKRRRKLGLPGLKLPRLPLGYLAGLPIALFRQGLGLAGKIASLALAPFALGLRLAQAVFGQFGRMLKNISLPRPPRRLRLPRPAVELPIPRLRLPKIKLPRLARPKLRLPKLAAELPKLPIPRLRLPKIKLPKIKLPKLGLPRLRFPAIKLPLPRLPIPKRKAPSLGAPEEKTPAPEAPIEIPSADWPEEAPPEEWPEEITLPEPEKTPEDVAAAAAIEETVPTVAGQVAEEAVAPPAEHIPVAAKPAPRFRLIRVVGPFSALWGRLRSLLRLPSGIPLRLRRRVPVRRRPEELPREVAPPVEAPVLIVEPPKAPEPAPIPAAAAEAVLEETLPAVEAPPAEVPFSVAKRRRSGRRGGQLGQLGARGVPGLPWITEVDTPQYLVAFELRPTAPRLPKKPLRKRFRRPRMPRPKLSSLLIIFAPIRFAWRLIGKFPVPGISAIPIVGPALSRARARVKLPPLQSLPVIGPPLTRLRSRVALPDLTKLPVVGPLLVRVARLISLPKRAKVKDALLRPRLPQRLLTLAAWLRPHNMREIPPLLWTWIRETIASPARRMRLILYTGAAMMAFLFLNAIVMVGTVNPAFCGACHSMKPEYNAWKRSSHANVTCYACHLSPSIRPAIIMFFYDHITVGPPGAVAEFITGYEKINAESEVGEHHIINEACERCHVPENRRFTPGKNLKINHEKHLKKGIHCTQCHNRVAHLRAPGYKNNMTMRRCFRCHAKEKEHEYKEKRFAKANPKCSNCHPPGFNLRPPNHRLGDWAPPRIPEIQYATAPDSPPLYGSGEREKWELQYAKAKVTVTPGKVRKVYRHAQVAKSDVEYCYMCHVKEEFCDKCHKTTMPHERPWFDRHGAVVTKIADKSQMFCQRCHVVPKLCVNCHKRQVYPHPINWAPTHGKQAKVDKAEACWTCHRRDFCKGCHTEVEMPHPKFWLGMHRQYLRNRPVSDCLNCHVKQQCEYCHSNHGVHNQHQIYKFTPYKPPIADGHDVTKLTPGGPDGRLLR